MMDKFRFLLACLILGFSAMVSQIVLFRETLVCFYGNELSLGAILFVWLFWVGVGSRLGNRLYPGPNDPTKKGEKNRSHRILFYWYFASAFVLILTFMGIRFSRIILGTMPGEIVGFIPMLFFTFIIMFPLCLLWGIIFVLNSRLWEFEKLHSFLVNKVYLWESLGAGLGGLLATLVLIPQLSNFNIIIFLSILNLFLSALLLAEISHRLKTVSVWLGVIILIFIFFSLRIDKVLDDFSLSKAWRNLPIIHSEDSVYGNISVMKTSEQVTFYENGLLLFSYPDEYSAEEAVLFALSQNPEGKRLLLIGGGLGGVLSLVQRFKGLMVDYVELDPKLISMGKRFLPEAEIKSINETNVICSDGRLFVKKISKNRKDLYDIIILNLPDPFTAQINRFYTYEFFQMVKRVLKEDGVFSFRVSSQVNYINKEQALYLSSLYRTLKLNFDEVKALPGGNAIFLASAQRELTDSWQKISSNLEAKGIQAKYVSKNYLPDRLSKERIESLYAAMNLMNGKVNYDFLPICYFYNTILWSTQFKSLEKPIFLFLIKVKEIWFILIPSLILFFILSFLYKKRDRFSYLALSAIFMVGFSSILLEIFVLLSFQIFYGYIYSQIGLILTSFMLGLALGAFLTEMKISKGKMDLRWLSWIQFMQVLLSLLFLLLITYFSQKMVADFWMVLSFYLLMALSGTIGGMGFVCANYLYLSSRRGKGVGTGYSIDLFGSAVSSILVSGIFLPLLGIPLSLLMAVLMNLVLFIIIMSSTLNVYSKID
jgi:spermidine synthase